LRRAILSLAVMIVFRLGSMVVSATPSKPARKRLGHRNRALWLFGPRPVLRWPTVR
jgi:hypothetical protein